MFTPYINREINSRGIKWVRSERLVKHKICVGKSEGSTDVVLRFSKNRN
jgi:hypothetical protein